MTDHGSTARPVPVHGCQPASVAAIRMVAGHVSARAALILQAGQLRSISLALPPLQRRVS